MIWIIIIGMAVVTMIPRIIPAFIVDKLLFPDWINRWLSAIPYAALGALIFPGIMSVKPDQPHLGLFGGIFAIVLAYLGVHIIIVVIAAIATVYLLT
ncbi:MULTISPECIES: AzlD domain-containing protein [Clostridia]|uniref:AzlD domain-containing protein n=1 Tax=Clostridia TaxID=186801 RepID=UPI000EA12426|nr:MULTISPECIES: AzlD domain-containing protein [Clostridia]NBJ69117.1 AzlD domain-containing protein [Roseburia sp. 1XD42-34]RKI79541.1 AzlD domain-containing protein [Clostridium sp. 1xD42-85]